MFTKIITIFVIISVVIITGIAVTCCKGGDDE